MKAAETLQQEVREKAKQRDDQERAPGERPGVLQLARDPARQPSELLVLQYWLRSYDRDDTEHVCADSSTA